MKVACMCRCEQEKEAEEKRREQARKDMERVDRLKRTSLMDKKFRGARFSELQVTKYNARNLKLCQRYVSRFDEMMEKNQGLIFWGDVGTGKSYAAACIANELLSKGVPVVMTSLVKILEIVQSGDEKVSSIISRLNSARLVIGGLSQDFPVDVPVDSPIFIGGFHGYTDSGQARRQKGSYIHSGLDALANRQGLPQGTAPGADRLCRDAPGDYGLRHL